MGRLEASHRDTRMAVAPKLSTNGTAQEERRGRKENTTLRRSHIHGAALEWKILEGRWRVGGKPRGAATWRRK